MSIISTNEKQFAKYQFVKMLKRLDGRNLVDHRNIQVKYGLERGQVELDLGNTKFFTKVQAEITEPKQERPNEGFLRFKIDLSVLGDDQQQGAFRGKQYSNEISKLLERIIKDSKVIDVESLSLIIGKFVWQINVNCILINNDGNLLDACYLSAIIALLHFRKPCVQIKPGNQISILSDEQKKPTPLSIHHIPISFTFGFFADSKIVVADPSNIEEEVMDGRVTIALNIYHDLCAIHKPGGAPLDVQIMPQLLKVCKIKVSQYTRLIREVIQHSENYSILDIQKNIQYNLQQENNQMDDEINIKDLQNKFQ